MFHQFNLCLSRFCTLTFVYLLLICPVMLYSQEVEGLVTESVSLNYASPDELQQSLSMNKDESGCYELLLNNNSIAVRFDYSSNKILLTGSKTNVDLAQNIIALLDLPPRQIVIEAKIVEIDNEKLREIGIDWQDLLDNTGLNGITLSYNYTTNEQKQITPYNKQRADRTDKSMRGSLDINQNVGDFLKILQETGSGKIINIPHIVTTNNKKGTIFDGKRLNYVANISSYANIYETKEITAGLMLTVTPSLGQSGFLKLNVLAKFTSLEYPQDSRSNLNTNIPIESGQTLENSVIIKNEESLVLGGFKKTEYVTLNRKVPILGTILPFLFSRDVLAESTKDVLIILKPRIIDLKTQQEPEIK